MIEVVTPPVLEPVTLAEAKEHLRVDHTTEDTLIGSYISAARKMAEGILSRALITQTLRQWGDEFPDGNVLSIIRGPVQSVTSVKAFATDDTQTTLATSEYQVVTTDPAAVVLRSGSSWPSTSLRFGNGVAVEYVAGYGTNPANVPPDIRAWLFLKIGDLYENREATITTGAVASSVGFDKQLLASEKEWSV